MEEIWKDILGYEGLYQVSNFGRVKSLKWGKERILKPSKDRGGYLLVVLSKGKRNTNKVHRLVAQAFIPNPQGLPQVNHKDEDKTNNMADNLEYCDTQYNINYGTATQRRAKKMSKKVLCVETGVIYSSIMDVQRQLGFSKAHICDCCNGKRNTHKGYHWKYVVEN